MSTFGSQAAIALPSGSEMEREAFFNALFHDDRNSRYFITVSRDDGSWTEVPLKLSSLYSYPFDGQSNYYVSHNGFSGKRRLMEQTRQINALFFDLDCHEAPQGLMRQCVDAVLERIIDGAQEERIPNPTIIVDSGRGLQLLYVLERSIPYRFRGGGTYNEKGVEYCKHVQVQLADVFEELIEGIPYAEVDRKVFDLPRVGRIPGTFNTKAGRYASLVNVREAYYHLPDLATYTPSKLKDSGLVKEKPAKRKKAVIMNFKPLMMSRLRKVDELQAYRQYDCEGNREHMCFVYYNTAVQIYCKEDARDLLTSFNAKFKKPLPQSELNGIVRSVSEVVNVKGEKGYYLLNAQTLIDKLALTEKEMLDLQFFASKRMVERLEAKRKTQEKRDTRNERIISLHDSGTMTQQQIAEDVGCTVRTVHAVLKAAGRTRLYKTSAKATANTAARSGVPLRALAKRVLDDNLRVVSAEKPASHFHTYQSEFFWRPCLSRVVKRMITPLLSLNQMPWVWSVTGGFTASLGFNFGSSAPPP